MTRNAGWLVAVVVGVAGRVAAAGPVMGSFSITPGLGAALVANGDIKDFYGPGLSISTSPVALALGGGINYNVSDNVQLGARYDRVLKKYDIDISSGGTVVGTHTWNVNANAFLGEARFLIRGAAPDRWFALSLKLGQYMLSGATVKVASTGGSGTPYKGDLTGGAFGGEVDLEMEKMFGAQVAGSFMIGWRFAKVATVTLSDTSGEFTLLNDDGSNAALDLGGFNAGVTLRFYFGGSGSSVSSY